MHKDIEKVLFNRDEIELLCKELGKRITKDYTNKELIVVGLLNGCLPFVADLVRNIDLDIKIEYIKTTSYVGVKSTGEIKIIDNTNFDANGKHILIVDDILDTGLTLKFVTSYYNSKNAASVKTCTLLDKQGVRKDDYCADYVGTPIPNAFVVGYGLDYNGYYRNLDHIGILKKEVYSGGDK